MTERIVIAGFGGQGALTMGYVIAALYLNRGMNVTWMPSYGAEMRGGTANCSVIASDNVIGSPIVAKDADVIIAMNSPSLDKFEAMAAPGGHIITNTSIITREVARLDVKILKADATNIAVELKNPRVQNMVMLGAYLTLRPDFTDAEIKDALADRFGKDSQLLPLNIEAVRRGKISV